MLVNTNPAVHC